MAVGEEGRQAQRFCKACGRPAGEEKLCENCGAVLGLPEKPGLVDDEAAVARRVFEERDQ